MVYRRWGTPGNPGRPQLAALRVTAEMKPEEVTQRIGGRTLCLHMYCMQDILSLHLLWICHIMSDITNRLYKLSILIMLQQFLGPFESTPTYEMKHCNWYTSITSLKEPVKNYIADIFCETQGGGGYQVSYPTQWSLFYSPNSAKEKWQRELC